MRYFIPFYGLWCMGKDAGQFYYDNPGGLVTFLAMAWQSILLVVVVFLCHILMRG